MLPIHRLILPCIAIVCGSAPYLALGIDPAAVRAQLVLPQEPAGALSLTAAKQQLTNEPKPIVVAGRIGAKGIEPFLEN